MPVESGTEWTRCRAYLKEKLDSLNGSDSCLGDSSGDSSGQEILGKRNGGLTHLGCFVFAYLCVVVLVFPLKFSGLLSIPPASGSLACSVEMADFYTGLRIFLFKARSREKQREHPYVLLSLVPRGDDVSRRPLPSMTIGEGKKTFILSSVNTPGSAL